MADFTPYKLQIEAKDADRALLAALDAAKAAGILLADGTGRLRSAVAGQDYGYGMLAGNGPPSTNVAANIGQHYFDMAATAPPYEYICVGYTATGYVWRVFGDNGAGFKVLGRFLTLAALQNAVAAGDIPQPTPGDAYFVGETAPYPVYYFDGLTLKWEYYGPLGGSTGGSGDTIGIPPHGGAGQVLGKNSDADYDVGWVDAVPDGSLVTAKYAEASVTGDVVAPGTLTLKNYADGSVGRDKLAIGATHTAFAVSLPASGWVDSRQTVAAAGVPADSDIPVLVGPTPASASAYAEAGVRCIDQNANSLTFSAESTVSQDLNINVCVLR